MKWLGGFCLSVLAVSASGCKKAKRPDQSEKTLGTLGYLSSTPVAENESAVEGVTLLEPAAVSPGITSVCFLRKGGCVMIDMSGTVVHRLPTPAPDSAVTNGLRNRGEGTYVLRDYDATDFIVLNGPLIQRIDWSGTVKWSADPGADYRFHHDLAVQENKDIVALYTGERWIDHKGAKIPILDDGLFVIHPDGTFKKLVSFYDVLKDRIAESSLDTVKTLYESGKLAKTTPSNPSAKYASVDGPADIFHSNSVVVAPRDTPQWKKGDYIICLRDLAGGGLLVALDHETFAVRWSFEGAGLDHPHDPELMPNGNITLFDNGMKRDWTRVVEIDPTKNAIVHEYKSSKPLLLSHEAGGAQPLANGNLLITETERGYLFEVTPDGKTVWEYWAPILDVGTGKVRDVVFRAHRATVDSPSPVVELQKLVTQVAGPGAPAMAAIHKARPEGTGGRAWPVGRNNTPRMSFVFSQTDAGVTYHATSGPVPAGEYRVTITRPGCRPDGVTADFGTFTSTGGTAEWAFDGKLVGSAPEGGLTNLVDRYFVAVTPKGAAEAIACGKLFAL